MGKQPVIYPVYRCYIIEEAEMENWVTIRHPKTQHVVDACRKDQYEALIDKWFEVPEYYDADHP